MVNVGVPHPKRKPSTANKSKPSSAPQEGHIAGGSENDDQLQREDGKGKKTDMSSFLKKAVTSGAAGCLG